MNEPLLDKTPSHPATLDQWCAWCKKWSSSNWLQKSTRNSKSWIESLPYIDRFTTKRFENGENLPIFCRCKGPLRLLVRSQLFQKSEIIYSFIYFLPRNVFRHMPIYSNLERYAESILKLYNSGNSFPLSGVHTFGAAPLLNILCHLFTSKRKYIHMQMYAVGRWSHFTVLYIIFFAQEAETNGV